MRAKNREADGAQLIAYIVAVVIGAFLVVFAAIPAFVTWVMWKSKWSVNFGRGTKVAVTTAAWVAAVVAVVVAFSSLGSTEPGGTPTRTPASPAAASNAPPAAPAVHRRHHRFRQAHRAHRALRARRAHHVAKRIRRSHGLSYSTASNVVVQSQPPAGSCHAIGSGAYERPAPSCTPGALNPAVTQATIYRTICASGWTETVRPPESISEQEKLASMAAYGDTGSPGAYEYDHFVPLELGGATNDPRNLWPEPGGIPNPKDALENKLKDEICAGQISLAQAQHEIVRNWTSLAAPAPTQAPPPPPPSSSPAPASPPASAVPSPHPTVVHPGAFCAPVGARGVTDRGTPMTCKSTATDPRNRWRSSG